MCSQCSVCEWSHPPDQRVALVYDKVMIVHPKVQPDSAGRRNASHRL